MKKLATSLLATLAALGVSPGLSATTQSKIVVGIVVDQLRTDYLDQLQNLFASKGFRTFMSDGVYFRDVDFGATGLDAASGTAMAVTGALPSFSGVPSSMIYDPQTNAQRPALTGTGPGLTNDSFTPEGLLVSTVADEFAVASDGKGVIYSVAADPQQAVILAGHAAKSALWLNNTSGQWATSSYYGTLPAVASAANMRAPLSHRADTIRWLNYRYSTRDRDVYRKIAASPAGNREVTDMALRLIESLPQGDTPGMVNVGYTLAPYRFATGSTVRETESAYISLDTQIGRLIDAVDRRYGKGNALIWLSSTGYATGEAIDEKRFRIPGGEFSTRKAQSLLNSYLSARHGNASYVALIKGGNVYLDRKSIEAQRLDPDAVAADARDFLSRMSGVQRSYIRAEILSPTGDETRKLAASYDPKTGPDVILSFMPGWTVTDDISTQKVMSETPAPTPFFIMGPDIAPRTVSTPVEGVAIAPTLTTGLRIRAPNAAQGRPIHLDAPAH